MVVSSWLLTLCNCNAFSKSLMNATPAMTLPRMKPTHRAPYIELHHDNNPVLDKMTRIRHAILSTYKLAQNFLTAHLRNI